MAKRKSLKERLKNVLTTSDLIFLKKNAHNFTLAQLSGRLGHPANVIARELKAMGISPLEKVAFTEEILITNVNINTQDGIASA